MQHMYINHNQCQLHHVGLTSYYRLEHSIETAYKVSKLMDEQWSAVVKHYNNNTNNNICIAPVCLCPLALTHALNLDSLVNRIKVWDVRRP